MKKDMPLLSIVNSNVKHLPINQIVSFTVGQELPVRVDGEFEQRAFYLDADYDWIVGYDSFGEKILVALHPQQDEIPGGSLLKKG